MAQNRATTRRWAAFTLLGVTLGYVAVLLGNVRHFYSDDTELQYVPLWVRVGTLLRDGQFPTVVPEEWMAGNYLVEGQSSLFNPPQFLVNVLAPSFGNLLVLATVVKFAYTLILALGVFRVCLGYGAQAHWAAVAGVAFPFSGWVLFFDQATWVLALAGTAWLTHAWASGMRYARGQSGPLPVFVFLVFTISVGYVWPGVEAGLLIGCVVVGEFLRQRQWQGPVKLALAAGSAALLCVIVYIAGVLTSEVTWRSSHGVTYAGEMTMAWSQSLNASLPSTYPAVASWFGPIMPMPVSYIAWFLVPAVVFVDWRHAARSARELSGVLLFTAAILLWTAGPAAIGPLRWPARMLPMLALGLLVLVCTLLSRHGTLAHLRVRVTVAGVFIALMAYKSIATVPATWKWHVASALAVGAAGAFVLWLARNRGQVAVCVALVLSVSPIAFLQVERADPHPLAFGVPADVGDLRAAFPDFEGTTLQLSSLPLVPGVPFGPHPSRNGINEDTFRSLVWGNVPQTLGLRYVNGYTPVGYRAFASRLCMQWDGTTCPQAFAQAFAVEPSTGLPLVDLMKVDRVVLQRLQYPGADQAAPPPGWRWVRYPGHTDTIYVLEREGGAVSGSNGRIAAAVGATATSTSETNSTSRARVSSAAGGQVVFSRLDWPGYQVTLDGRAVEHTEVLGALLAVQIPAGTDNADLVVSYEFPGWGVGAATAAAGLAAIAVLHLLHLRTRRPEEELVGEPADATEETSHENREALAR